MSKSLASSLLPPPSSCKTSSVCVKIFPLCHLQRPRQCPLSSHSSNYPSVGPGRQMLSEPSSIRHSAAAWHTQYDTKKEREKKTQLSHFVLSHKFSPHPSLCLPAAPRLTVAPGYIRRPIHVQPPAVGCNLFRLGGQSCIYMWKATVYLNIVTA